jgi:hypothetical protein
MDNDIEGEQFLSNEKVIACRTDDDQVRFKSSRTLRDDARFRALPVRVGHTQYEKMCKTLHDTSQWSSSRPPVQSLIGRADCSKRSPEPNQQVSYMYIGHPCPVSHAATGFNMVLGSSCAYPDINSDFQLECGG